MTFRIPIALALAIIVSLMPVDADPPVRKITVSGTAIIKVVPDEMNWTMQISVNDATLEKAKGRHDQSLGAALDYIKSLGAAVKDLQTGGIRFDKNMDPGDDSFAKAHPYTCTTQFTFTLVDFDKYGPIADSLAKLDGAQVQNIEYASSQEPATKREALKKALRDAFDKAADLADVAGCKIHTPLEITEQDVSFVRPQIMTKMFAARASEGTPDAVAGQIEITGRVEAVYDLITK